MIRPGGTPQMTNEEIRAAIVRIERRLSDIESRLTDVERVAKQAKREARARD
jgi:hypothetical protein